jgi:hypothetical protein
MNNKRKMKKKKKRAPHMNNKRKMKKKKKGTVDQRGSIMTAELRACSVFEYAFSSVAI